MIRIWLTRRVPIADCRADKCSVIAGPGSITATGSAHVVSRAIEEYARAQGHVNALVVPWESDASRLTMAVTSVRSDGWAIEHINLGTITLTPTEAGRRVSRLSSCAAGER